MKKVITLALLLMFVLCGCSVETSSTTTTTTSTTVNGETTTTTTTTETTNGTSETSTDTITATEDDPTGLRAKWTEYFSEGAEGVSVDDYNVYMAYNDPESITSAAIMILNTDNSEMLTYLIGDVVAEDDHYKIVDVDGDEELPFWLTDTQIDNGFEIRFKDDDTVALGFVDQATIIDHMISLWEVHRDTYLANHQ